MLIRFLKSIAQITENPGTMPLWKQQTNKQKAREQASEKGGSKLQESLQLWEQENK